MEKYTRLQITRAIFMFLVSAFSIVNAAEKQEEHEIKAYDKSTVVAQEGPQIDPEEKELMESLKTAEVRLDNAHADHNRVSLRCFGDDVRGPYMNALQQAAHDRDTAKRKLDDYREGKTGKN